MYMCSCVIVCHPSPLQSPYHLAKPEVLSEQPRTLGLQQDKVRCVYVREGREGDCCELCSSIPLHSYLLFSSPMPWPLLPLSPHPHTVGTGWGGERTEGMEWSSFALPPSSCPIPLLPSHPPRPSLSLWNRQPSSPSFGLARVVWWWRGWEDRPSSQPNWRDQLEAEPVHGPGQPGQDEAAQCSVWVWHKTGEVRVSCFDKALLCVLPVISALLFTHPSPISKFWIQPQVWLVTWQAVPVANLDNDYLITVFWSLLKPLPAKLDKFSLVLCIVLTGFKYFMFSDIVTHKMCIVHKIVKLV